MTDASLAVQRRVAGFVAEHDLHAPPEYRLLDLASEVGELAKDAAESTDYGSAREVRLSDDEVGDALFALLALADEVGVDAGEALETSLEKYEQRMSETGSAGSGSEGTR